MAAPQIAGSAAPQQTALASALSGGQPGAGADAQRQGLETLMGQIRDLQQMAQAIAADFPNLAPDVQQITNICKKMVVNAASQSPAQTASGMAVPL